MIKKTTDEAKPFDWRTVHERLDASCRALAEGWRPDAPAKRKILRERARALAGKERQERSQERLQILEFFLAQERYGIDTSYIREVCPLTDITPLPAAPAFVLGIIAVRGEILSVTDLKAFFELPSRGLNDLNKAIVLSDNRMEFAILADAIVGTRPVALADIQPSLPASTAIGAGYLRGVTAERLVILDATAILEDEKLIVKES